MKAEEQCPSCQANTFSKVCLKGRARINQDAAGMFYKTIACPLWSAKVAPLVNLDICPTCGQKLPPLISGSIGRIDLTKFDSPPSSIRPNEDRITQLVEIEKKAQMVMPGIIPDELMAPISGPQKRIPRRSKGDKRPRKKFLTEAKNG